MISLEALGEIMGAYLYPGKEGAALEIKGVAPLETARKGDLSFFADLKYKKFLRNSEASAVIVREKEDGVNFAQLVHPNPRLAIAKACLKLNPIRHSFYGQSSLAFVHEEAHVHKTVTLYPHVFIDHGARIEQNCVLYPGVYVGPGCFVGEGSVLYPNCVLMEGTKIGKHAILHGGSVIGGDGFGFVPTKEGNVKIPQLGRVVVEDNVEIGPLCTVDRATFDETIVREGTKFDSQVHVGHNVDIGKNSLVCAQVAFGGCAKVGEGFITAGQSAVGAAVNVCSHVTLGPCSAAIQDVTESGEYMGMPLSKLKDWKKEQLALKRLPQMRLELKRLQESLDALEKEL